MVTKKQFEDNIAEKLEDDNFASDMPSKLRYWTSLVAVD
jgi:hypothetical protein